DGFLDVAGVLDPADAADQVLGVVLLDDPAAHRGVAAGDRLDQLAEGDVVSAQGVGIDVDLVLQGHAADGADLGHAGHGVDLGPDVVFLKGPAAAGLQLAALDGVPEDLAHGGGVGGQVGDHALGQEGAGQGETLQHALAGEVEVDVVLEDQGDH